MEMQPFRRQEIVGYLVRTAQLERDLDRRCRRLTMAARLCRGLDTRIGCVASDADRFALRHTKPVEETPGTYSLCVCCGRVAVADVEVSPGLEVGMCHEHAERRRAASRRSA